MPTVFFGLKLKSFPRIYIHPYTLFLYFWLRWVFVAVRRVSLVVASGGCSSLRCAGFSLWWPLLLQGTGSKCAGFSSCGTWAQELWLAGSGIVCGLRSCGSRSLERRLSSCGSWALERRLSSCGLRSLERGLSSCGVRAPGCGLRSCGTQAPYTLFLKLPVCLASSTTAPLQSS